MDQTEDVLNENSLLVSTFFIGQARFGIDTSKVQEVVVVRDITPVYSSAAFVLGVMNLRGRIVTVVDTGEKLNLGAVPETETRRIFIVRWSGEYVGLLVEQVGDVANVDREQVQKTPGNVAGVQAELINGVFPVDKHLVALVNIERLLRE